MQAKADTSIHVLEKKTHTDATNKLHRRVNRVDERGAERSLGEM